jgi:hypothetical protein
MVPAFEERATEVLSEIADDMFMWRRAELLFYACRPGNSRTLRE